MTDTDEQYSQASYGGHPAEVAVHASTAICGSARYLSVFKEGRILNAKTALYQALGDMIWGFGATLLEGTAEDQR
jgi:CO/xanthine dehydrogenase Mo-binding subunit